MSSSKIGWWVEPGDLGTNKLPVLSELKSYRANWHLVLGDKAEAVALLPHVNTGVIYREFDPFNEWTDGSTFDNYFWTKHTPESIINHVKQHHSDVLHHDKLYFSIGNNEPATKGKTKDFVQWCVKLADLGYLEGIRFAIAEIASAKTIDHGEVESGLWDDLLRVMNDYRNFHIFTVHEYTTGILPASLLPDYPLNLNKPDVLRHDGWVSAKLNLKTIAGNYHLGRGALVTHVRAKQIGLDPIPFVVTECAFDWMEDINNSPERQAVIDPLRLAFKPVNHDALRGSTGHELYHHWLMVKTSYIGNWNDYLFAQYKWMVNAYPDECGGFCIFALNRDWNVPEGHDMSLPRNAGFRQLVIDKPVPETATMPEIFNPLLYGATIRTTARPVNMRAGMSTYMSILGEVTTEPMRVRISKKTNPAQGYNWYKYERQHDTHLETGYIADLDVLKIEYDIDNQEPEPAPVDIETAVKNALDPLLRPREVDIPLPAFTMTVPTLLIEPLAQYFDGLSGVYAAMAQRLRSGTPTVSQIANEIYSTVSLNDDDNTLLNEVLNGDHKRRGRA